MYWREQMTKRKSKAEKDEAVDDDPRLSKALRESNCRRTYEEMRNNTDCPSCGGDCCDGHVETTAEYVKRVGKSMMLDEICDPEPLSGYTLLDEIEFTLYSAQSEMNRLQKLIFLYKEQQE